MASAIAARLSADGLASAAAALRAYADDVGRRGEAAATAVADEGAAFASSYLDSALPAAVVGSWTTGALSRSLSAERRNAGAAVVARGANAAFVEFGTGVRGKRNPYPGDGWAYDVSGRGEAGWMFPDPSSPTGETWTQGLPSVPYMWTTAEHLREVGGSVAARSWA